jgi:hypothetical protein
MAFCYLRAQINPLIASVFESAIIKAKGNSMLNDVERTPEFIFKEFEIILILGA